MTCPRRRPTLYHTHAAVPTTRLGPTARTPKQRPLPMTPHSPSPSPTRCQQPLNPTPPARQRHSHRTAPDTTPHDTATSAKNERRSAAHPSPPPHLPSTNADATC